MAERFALDVAKRYLTSRKRDGFISITAFLSIGSIALGVAALIVVMGVMNGFREELISKILGYQGHIMVRGYDGKIYNFNSLKEKINKLDRVEKTTPFTEDQVLATHKGDARGALVRGYQGSQFQNGTLDFDRIVTGDPKLTPEVGGVVVGLRLANRLGLSVGDRLTIVSPKPVSTAFGQQIRSNSYPVTAIVSFGIFNYDEVFVGMDLRDAQTFFRHGDAVSHIEIKISNPEDIFAPTDQVRALVDRTGQVINWRNFNQSLVEAIDTERLAMFLILSLLIVVAVFNIATSLFMLVKDKAADIAILRTMGASRGEIMQIFMLVGTAVGVMGIVLGSVLATLIATNIDAIKNGLQALTGTNLWDPSVRFISNITVKVDPTEVAATIGVALIMSFLATLIPARRAAKIDPIELLRYE